MLNLAATNSKKLMHIINEMFFPEFCSQKSEVHVVPE